MIMKNISPMIEPARVRLGIRLIQPIHVHVSHTRIFRYGYNPCWSWLALVPCKPGGGGGGGGGYSVWKRVGPTDCCPTAGERWLSRPMTAKKKKGGAVLLLYCRIGELSE